MNFASRDKAKKDNLAMHRMSFDIQEQMDKHFRTKEERDAYNAEMLRQCLLSDYHRLQAEVGYEQARTWLRDVASWPC